MQTPFDAMNDIAVQATRNAQVLFFNNLEGMQSALVESLRNAHAQAVRFHMAPKSLRESSAFERNLDALRSTLEIQRKALEAAVAV